MATVPQALDARPKLGGEAVRDEFAIRLGPAHGEVMTTEILLCSRRIHGYAAGTILIHVRAENGFSQAARAAVDEQHELLFGEFELREFRRIENHLDGLQFSEVITAANRAERGIELRGFQIAPGEKVADGFVPRMFELEWKFRPAIKLGVAPNEVCREQRHAATDVAADEVRINHTVCNESRADGRALAGVQIREADRGTHAIELGRGVELAHGFAFDPALGRGNKAYGGGREWSVHGS